MTTIVVKADCGRCSSPAALADSIRKSAGVRVASQDDLDFGSSLVAPLISRYGITRLPAVIVTGEIGKAKSLQAVPGGRLSGDAIVFSSPDPFYFDVSSGSVAGIVNVSVIYALSCAGSLPFLSQLRLAGVGLGSISQVNLSSPKGRSLALEYSLSKFPAVVLSGELSAYEGILPGIFSTAPLSADGSAYVAEKPLPPYYDASLGRAVGYVNLTIVRDASCASCYDPGPIHKKVLAKVGAAVQAEKSVDIFSAEGEGASLALRDTPRPYGDPERRRGCVSGAERLLEVRWDGRAGRDVRLPDGRDIQPAV